nr:RDD family protein [Wolbachia endosymbiont of Ctenocephalides felis wCfeT]
MTKCLSFLLSIVFEIFLIKRFNGTPGQLLFCIHIKDANTLKGITIMQATVRYILFRAFSLTATICILIIKALTDEHTSEWWLLPLLGLIFIAMILIIIHAIFDKRKQLFYDKIARTVAIVSIQPGGKIKSRQGMLKR